MRNVCFLRNEPSGPGLIAPCLSAPNKLVCAVLPSPSCPALACLIQAFHLHLLLSVGIGLCKNPLPVNVSSLLFFLSFPPCLSLSITGVLQSFHPWDAALALAGYQGCCEQLFLAELCKAAGGGVMGGGLIQQTLPQ